MLHIILTISQLALRGGGKLESLICESPFSCNFKFSAISCQPSAKTKSFNFSNFVSLLAKTQRNAKVVSTPQCSPIIFSDSNCYSRKDSEERKGCFHYSVTSLFTTIYSKLTDRSSKLTANSQILKDATRLKSLLSHYSQIFRFSDFKSYRNHCNEYIMNFNNLIIN